MQTPRSSLVTILKKVLDKEELRESVVYIIPNILSGDEIVVNRKKIKVATASQLLFVDLEPKANWSHKCRYILIDCKGETQSITEGQFPPDTEKLELLLKPENIEDWVLMTDKKYSA